MRFERSLFNQGCKTVAGLDEVGRGAWAGPVSVGITLITLKTLRRLPPTVRDSKLLTPLAREELFEPLAKAVIAYAIGHASPLECDELGMTAAQALAASRAFEQLPVAPDAIIVDGNHNYTGRKEAITLIKADRHSRLVAAASVLAKVTRDRMMRELAHRYHGYSLERNKGYASREHREAVKRLGTCDIHRLSWSFKDLEAEAQESGEPIEELCDDGDQGPARL